MCCRMSIVDPATHLEQERMEHTLPFVIGMEPDMTHIVRKCDLSPVTGFVMFLGSVVDVTWRRVNRAANEAYMVPLASGLIAGEAIVAVVIPLLVALGVISQ